VFGVDIEGIYNAVQAAKSGQDVNKHPLSKDEQKKAMEILESLGFRHWPMLVEKGCLQYNHAPIPLEADPDGLGIRPLSARGAFNISQLHTPLRRYIFGNKPDHKVVHLDVRSSHAALMANLSGCKAMLEAFNVRDDKGGYTGLYHVFSGERAHTKPAFNSWLNGGGIPSFIAAGIPNPEQFQEEVNALMRGPWKPALEWLEAGAARMVSSGIPNIHGMNARAHYLLRQEAQTMFRAMNALHGQAPACWELSIMMVNRDGALLSVHADYAQEAATMGACLLAKTLTNDPDCEPEKWIKAEVSNRWGSDDPLPDVSVGSAWATTLGMRVRSGGTNIPAILKAALAVGAAYSSDHSGGEWARQQKAAKEHHAAALSWLRESRIKASGIDVATPDGKPGTYDWLKQVLTGDKAFPVARYNIRENTLELDGKPVDDYMIRSRYFSLLKERYQLPVDATNNDIGVAVSDVARESNSYDPAMEWMEALEPWDKVERIHAGATTYLKPVNMPGADDKQTENAHKLYNVHFVKWMRGVLARLYIPGCKMDTMLVLTGKQDAGKSTFFELMAPAGSYASISVDPHNKDFKLQYRKLVNEWPELSGMKKRADIEALKAWLTTKVDIVRAPYAKLSVELPRIGTTGGTDNTGQVLLDPTGDRRSNVIPVGDIDLPALRRDMRQLWAEALHEWKIVHAYGDDFSVHAKGHPGYRFWWLTDDEKAWKAGSDEHFGQTDPYAPQVEAFFAVDSSGKCIRANRLCTMHKLLEFLAFRPDDFVKGTNIIGATLRQLGYERKRGMYTDKDCAQDSTLPKEGRYWYYAKTTAPFKSNGTSVDAPTVEDLS
jgi:hypothetical protein